MKGTALALYDPANMLD